MERTAEVSLFIVPATDEGTPGLVSKPVATNLALGAFAIGGFRLFGNPLEIQENQWFDPCLRWRFKSGLACAMDARILHLDITASDLAELPTTESEYESDVRLIRETADLGAENRKM